MGALQKDQLLPAVLGFRFAQIGFLQLVVQTLKQPFFHFAGGGFGKGHCNNTVNTDVILKHSFHQPGNQNSCFTGSGRS